MACKNFLTGNHPAQLGYRIDLQLQSALIVVPAKVVDIAILFLHCLCLLLFLIAWQSVGLTLERINLFDGLMRRTCDFSDGVASNAEKLVSC